MPPLGRIGVRSGEGVSNAGSLRAKNRVERTCGDATPSYSPNTRLTLARSTVFFTGL